MQCIVLEEWKENKNDIKKPRQTHNAPKTMTVQPYIESC